MGPSKAGSVEPGGSKFQRVCPSPRWRDCALTLALLSATGLTGCALTDPNNPRNSFQTKTQTNPGTLSASPSSLNFGNVNVGSKGTQTVTWTNSGNGSVTVSQVGVLGPEYSIGPFMVPQTLAPGQSTQMSVTFAPTAAGSVTGTVSVVSNAINSPATVTLSASGVQPALTVSPTSLAFGNILVGSSSMQTVTLTNSGTASLTISQATVTGAGFSLSGLTLPLTLPAGQPATFNVTFAPSTTGSVVGSVSLFSNAPNSPTAIALSGTGVTATFQLTASPTSLSFGNVLVGSSSTQTVTLSNTGNSSVSISQISVTGAGFSTSGLVPPVTLAAGQSTTFSVLFAPTVAGSVTGSVSVVSNATNSPATITLSGSGVQPALTVTPTSVSFGSVVVGTTNTQTVTLTNSGTASLTISQATVTGAGFSLSGLTLPLTLAVGQSSNFNVAFAPTATGSVTGSVSLVSNAPNSPTAIALSGTGVTATFQLTASPTSLGFGSVNVGSSSSQNVTLTNAGNSSVTISQVSVSGAAFSASGLTLPLTLAASQMATLSVTFTPTAAGSVTGSVSVLSNATNSPASITLSGSGVGSVTALDPPICGLANDTSNHIPSDTAWANFTPPALGGTYTDALYGCAVKRLTNAVGSGDGEITQYATTGLFSANDTYFIVFRPNGTLVGQGHWGPVIDLNGNVIVTPANLINSIPGISNGQWRWDPTDPLSLWNTAGNVLKKCTFNASTGAVSCTSQHTFTEYPHVVVFPNETDVNPDGWVPMVGQATNGGTADIFMFNLITLTKSAVGYTSGCTGDANGGQPMGDCFHRIMATPNDGWDLESKDGSGACAAGTTCVWDPVGGRQVVDTSTNHHDWGKDVTSTFLLSFWEDEKGNIGSSPCGSGVDQPVSVKFPPPSSNYYQCVFSNSAAASGWHISYRDWPNRSWVLYSKQASNNSERFNNDPSFQPPSTSGWNTYDNEIVLVRADVNGSPTKIYRLALSHAREMENYWAEPHATISRSGNYVAFSSNAAWGATGCGADGPGTCGDLYLIKIH